MRRRPVQKEFDLSDEFGDDIDPRKVREKEAPAPPPDELLRHAETVARNNEELRLEIQELRAKENGPGAILLNIIVVIWARFVMYVFIDRCVASLSFPALAADAVASILILVLYAAWIEEEWKRSAWLSVPPAVIAVVTLIIFAPVTCSGFFINGAAINGAEFPMIFGFIATVALLICASDLFIWMTKHTMEFLKHPIKKVLGN